ncbi:hypothetical protein F3Y22_tig00112344pilonHSYRG00236 [Hibiscus syriacus]|uniref:Uncharacterized protein n=1 Tax=Hibiscus syriacus TaxID=106335 RepID=A0A6A2X1B2_HIBSY|nr:hypothetical protein F3Y22_tig00112344pilonHSYRG00236 [Hibiscus syriacus]
MAEAQPSNPISRITVVGVVFCDIKQHFLWAQLLLARPGVLVFMTGWDDISYLKEKLQAHPILGDPTRVLLLNCHGSMASSEQETSYDELNNTPCLQPSWISKVSALQVRLPSDYRYDL